MEMIPFLIVEVTRAPRATAPTNSVTIDKKPTWIIVNVLAATDVALKTVKVSNCHNRNMSGRFPDFAFSQNTIQVQTSTREGMVTLLDR
jgi:hypothetical protein